MFIIIIGPPGAGKGTQSKLLAEKLDLIHISTGDMLRKAVEDKTELGIKVKEMMNNGQLVPDEIMIDCIKEILSKSLSRNGVILDGFPRTVEQAKALDKIIGDFGYNDIRIVTLNVQEEELIKRMSGRGRKDDAKNVIINRLKVFKNQTEPVMKYYNGKAKVYSVKGFGSIENISSGILNMLNGN